MNESPLCAAQIEKFLERSETLNLLLSYLQQSEDWIADHPGSVIEGLLIEDLGKRMLDPDPPAPVDRNETAQTLTYVSAPRILRIHDWLDATPHNRVAAMIEDPDVDPIYKSRLKVLFSILARAMVFHHVFDEKRRQEILAAIEKMKGES